MSKLTFRMLSYREGIEDLRCDSFGEVKDFGTPWARLFATLILSAILLAAIPCVAGQGAGPDFSYTGYSDATGASATLTFTISGANVINGKLEANDVCKDNVGLSGYSSHLPGTSITFTGTVSGGNWEGPSTTIAGSWTGGETRPCGGGIITGDPAFPNAGTYRIWLASDNQVHFSRMPTGYDFIFSPAGRAYIPSGAGPGGSGPGGQQQGNEMFLGYEKTGYNVYLDGNYVGTDGENGDALDGNFIVYDIPCWGNHIIVVDDGEFTHTLEYPFDCGTPYSINVGDDLFVVGSSQ